MGGQLDEWMDEEEKSLWRDRTPCYRVWRLHLEVERSSKGTYEGVKKGRKDGNMSGTSTSKRCMYT